MARHQVLGTASGNPPYRRPAYPHARIATSHVKSDEAHEKNTSSKEGWRTTDATSGLPLNATVSTTMSTMTRRECGKPVVPHRMLVLGGAKGCVTRHILTGEKRDRAGDERKEGNH